MKLFTFSITHPSVNTTNIHSSEQAKIVLGGHTHEVQQVVYRSDVTEHRSVSLAFFNNRPG